MLTQGAFLLVGVWIALWNLKISESKVWFWEEKGWYIPCQMKVWVGIPDPNHTGKRLASWVRSRLKVDTKHRLSTTVPPKAFPRFGSSQTEKIPPPPPYSPKGKGYYGCYLLDLAFQVLSLKIFWSTKKNIKKHVSLPPLCVFSKVPSPSSCCSLALHHLWLSWPSLSVRLSTALLLKFSSC